MGQRYVGHFGTELRVTRLLMSVCLSVCLSLCLSVAQQRVLDTDRDSTVTLVLQE